MSRQRGQGVVEVVALAPLVAACAAAFAIACVRVAAQARAESALATALAADAAGGSIAGALHGRARLVRADGRLIAVAVPAPLGAVTAASPPVRP